MKSTKVDLFNHICNQLLLLLLFIQIIVYFNIIK